MSLGVLVGRFGDYVRDNHSTPSRQAPEPDFPDALNHIRESVGYHLVPLVLLARADREFLPSESDSILDHCAAMARYHGDLLSAEDRNLLREYIDDFRPSLMQLDPALSRLSHSGTEEVEALLKAAQAVIEADGEASPEESRLLADILDEVGGLSGTPRTA